MNTVSLYRNLLTGNALADAQDWAEHYLCLIEWGLYRYGRIYDDLWPLNLAAIEHVGNPALRLTQALTPVLQSLISRSAVRLLSTIFCTTAYPHAGRWHQDAMAGCENDVLVNVCLTGRDEFEYLPPDGPHPVVMGTRRHVPSAVIPLLEPGDCLIFPPHVVHRGRCTTHRLTYHARFGTGTPHSSRNLLPTLTLRRFIKRTLATTVYYGLRPAEDGVLARRFTWVAPRVV